MNEDLQRVAERVIARRVELGMRTTKALADKARLSVRLLNDVENARRQTSWSSYASIEQALEWTAGSIKATLNGGEPTPVSGGRHDPGYVAAPGERVEQQVSNADVLAAVQQMRRDFDERLQAVERRLDERQ